MTIPEDVATVVVGAGPAGLATSHELQQRGIEHIVLERGDQPGFVWANLYDSLTLHTGRHLSGLPGRRLPRSTPLFAPRDAFLRYLQDYARGFSLPVRLGVELLRARPNGDGWEAETSEGPIRCRALVMATGIVSNPHVPAIPGREDFAGQVIHASSYRRPADVLGRRVLVVGIGNSGAEIAAELARAGRSVDLVVRSGANVVPLAIAGVPTQYLRVLIGKLPRPVQLAVASAVLRAATLRRGASPFPAAPQSPIDAIPVIGFGIVDEIGAGRVRVRPAIREITVAGARFEDGGEGEYDAIVLATGYRPALAPLGDLVSLDEKGFARRTDRVTSADQPNLWFVGQVYDTAGGIVNIARDAPRAAEDVARSLQPGRD